VARHRALELVEQRERKSLETKLLKECRIEERERTDRAPAPVAPVRELHTDVFNKAAKKPIDLTAEFEKASESGESGDQASGDSAQPPAPEAEITIQRRKRTRDREQDMDQSATRRDRDFDRGR
jgi:hypothetical protein